MTRVESTGLLLAAVATGSWAMPEKDPDPEAGTAEHAEPNGVSADIADSEGEAIAVLASVLELEVVAVSEESSLLQAAIERASRAAVVTPNRRVRTRVMTKVLFVG
ncbi:hypothetical protein GCM10009539_75400 [Cryptosporangium japonicum]|uniref:Uncharacterized protein n=1 Tax=Cryptosporangium japonicum TaxID=80872 RepID=A0ABP3ESF2_9ACTN